MKKYVALFLSLIMIFSLAACGSSGDKDGGKDGDKNDDAEATTLAEDETEKNGGESTQTLMSVQGVTIPIPAGMELAEGSMETYARAKSADGSFIEMKKGSIGTIEQYFEYYGYTSAEDFFTKTAAANNTTLISCEETEINGHRVVIGKYGNDELTFIMYLINISAEEDNEVSVEFSACIKSETAAAAVDASLQQLQINA